MMMKARASQGCPHAAEWLKNYELEKAKEAKEKSEKIEKKTEKTEEKPKKRSWRDAPPIQDRVVGSSHNEEFTVEELKEMAAKGCPLSRMKLKELEEEGVIEPDYKALESMAAQGCPMAKAKLARLAGKLTFNRPIGGVYNTESFVAITSII